LKEDLNGAEALESVDPDSPRATRSSGRLSRLSHRVPIKTFSDGNRAPRSVSSISQPHSDALSLAESSPKTSKNVRFNQKVKDEISSSSSPENMSESEEEEESDSESSEISTDSETSGDLSDTSSDVSNSESEAESTKAVPKIPPSVKPPGQGTPKTKSSNRRNKLRKRLAKLKELGQLPPDAGFAALRAWDAANGGGGPLTEVRDVSETRSPQAREQSEFELRRQRLLRELQSGGIDVDGHSEKENIPPQYRDVNLSLQQEDSAATNGDAIASCAADPTNEEPAEPPKKRTLDVASSRRMLFASLGVKTPKSKEDEEETRQKLAGPAKLPYPLPKTSNEEAMGEYRIDLVENWQEKLVVRATECVFDNVELSDPPFPFKQRWDVEAQKLIQQRRGNGRRERKKPRKTQDYEDNYEDDYVDGAIELNYDDQPLHLSDSEGVIQNQLAPQVDESLADLPVLPHDPTQIPDLMESEIKKGAILAFKQLHISKATNWQPQVSHYRVAEVEGQLEGGSFRIRLAKRDREQLQHDLGEEVGTHRCTGFEMPGFEDEQTEDDGFREVSFGDLIEPKLLQAAQPTTPSDVEVGSLEASLSVQ
jgi:hypothetical protein